METCKHCGRSTNTHQRVSYTCPYCGKPMQYKVYFVGLTVDLNKIELRERNVSSMHSLERAIFIDSSPLELNGRQLYADTNGQVYKTNFEFA